MLVVVLSAVPLYADSTVRYEAVFSDGTRLEGEQITGWGVHPGTPQLDNTYLQDAKRPLRWLRNLSLKPWRIPAAGGGYIEFVGGDRIIGRVIGSRPSSEAGGVYTPAHLLVAPAMSLPAVSHSRSKQPTPVRVLIGSIRRIVMTETPRPGRRGGTLLYHDARRVDFVGIRPGYDSLHLLLSNGSLNVKLTDIAEVNFPRIDPWDAYFRALGTLSPSCRSRLVRFETVGGLIATGSELRFRAMPYPTDEHLTRALAHLKRIEEHLARAQKTMKEQTEKFDKARAEYTRQSGELDKQLEAARKSHDKARADLKLRSDQQKKKDADLLTEKRRKLDREFKLADEAMVKRLAGEKPEKRGAMLKAFRLKQTRLRKTRDDALEAEKSKLYRQRLKELADSDTREMQKFTRLEADFKKRADKLKKQFAQATSLWERQSRSLNHARAQRAAATGAGGGSKTWRHVIQPVWSLDALHVPFNRICMRWSFAPDRVPLSRAHPTVSVSPPLQPWRVDRNSEGKFFRSGGRSYAWGFGVHAYSELSFTLPRFANSFQARLGLDCIVADGGCVRARVFGGSTTEKPLYESGLLVGSKKTVNTATIAIKPPANGPNRLILQADTAHHGRPSGTDPLNIRDKLDWLDPVIGFDHSALREAVQREAVKQRRAWNGWTVKFDKRGVYTWTTRFWKDQPTGPGRFATLIRAEKHPLVLSRQITVGPRDNWLTVDVGTFDGDTFRMELLPPRIDKKKMAPELVPVRQEWQKRNAPPAFAIGQYRGKKVTIELIQPPGGPGLCWLAARIGDELPGEYRLAVALKSVGKENMKVPKGLGWALQSETVDKPGRLALIEINRLGGLVNFWNPTVAPIRDSEFANILIGDKWTGGDKGFMTLAKVTGLKSLLLAGDAGISDAAVEKLQAQIPALTVRRFDWTPSGLWGPRCHMVTKNLSGKDVIVYWSDFNGKHSSSRKLKPNAAAHHGSAFGCRYEAHIDGELVETYNVPSTPGEKAYVIWEIKGK